MVQFLEKGNNCIDVYKVSLNGYIQVICLLDMNFFFDGGSFID